MLEANKYIVRNYFAALDRAGLPSGEAFLAAGFHAHVNGLDNPFDAQSYQAFYEGLYCALPQIRHEIGEMVAEGDCVAVQITAVGQHSGKLDGLRPCGKVVRVPMFMLIHLSSGKIARIWMQFDQLYLLQQLGALPSTQTLVV